MADIAKRRDSLPISASGSNHNNSGKRDGVNLSYFIMCLTVFCLFFAKSVYFYTCIKIGLFSPIFAAASTAFLILIFVTIYLINKRAGTITLFVLYSLLSLLMCIDVVYFSYFNKLPSIVVAQMVTLLSDVDSSILSLVTLDRMIMVIDLPLWFLWKVSFSYKDTGHNDKWFFPLLGSFTNNVRRKKLSSKAFSRILIILLILCIIVMASALMRNDFTHEYFKNEILMYHLLDIHEVYFYEEEERAVNPSDYLYAYSDEEKDSPYYGIAEGKNLIVIQVEAMQAFILNREYNGQVITPFLNTLLSEDTVFFDNYYYLIGGGNTSDAEFAVNNSLYAPDAEAAYIKYEENDFYGLPWIMKDNGYTGAHAFHGYNGEFWNRENAYIKQGFDDYTSGEDFDQIDIIGNLQRLSDREFFSQSVDIMATYEEPFYSFMITLSSHHPYIIEEEYHLLSIKDEHKNTLFGNYLQSMRYTDYAFEMFFEYLKESGLYENTVVVIYGDHFGLPNYDWYSKYYMTELLGHDYYENDMFNVPFIIHIPGLGESETISTTGGHIDAAPTILHLFGIENRKSVMFGQNLFTAKSGILYEQTHMERGSFISDDVIYSIAQNGIDLNNKAYDKKTGEVISSVPYRSISAKARDTILDCMAILEDNAVIVNK